MQTIILATHNPDKARELQVLMTGREIAVRTLADYPEIGDIPETGATLLENSLIKARTVHEITGWPVIADDTGLEVDALNGAPGIYAARYAGENATYSDNINKLLDQLKDIPSADRTARFRTVMIYIDQDSEIWAEGVVEGIILSERKGSGGFGYDSVFSIPEQGKTFAEMSSEEKQKISHRGQAAKALLQKIKSRLHQSIRSRI